MSLLCFIAWLSIWLNVCFPQITLQLSWRPVWASLRRSPASWLFAEPTPWSLSPSSANYASLEGSILRQSKLFLLSRYINSSHSQILHCAWFLSSLLSLPVPLPSMRWTTRTCVSYGIGPSTTWPSSVVVCSFTTTLNFACLKSERWRRKREPRSAT